MAETIWVVGGEQRGVPHWSREWKLYRKGLVVKVEEGRVRRVLDYESPPEHRPDADGSILFKVATIQGDRAYLCTQTEVLVCDFPSFSIRQIISLPCFNDVHHVAVAPDGRLFVAVTGLDAVAELAPDGQLLRLQSVLPGSVWERFSQTIDYRKVPTTKPHLSHPNFIFFLDGVPWVTRFTQRDAVPVYRDATAHAPFHLGEAGVHDGVVSGGQIYFTAVDGLIMRFDLQTREKQTFDLNRIPGAYHGRPLGWCRGILPGAGPSPDQAWVGFSRIRYTALRQNVDWIRHGFRDADRQPPAPTRVALYDLAAGTIAHEVDLEGEGMNTVFSIHHGH